MDHIEITNLTKTYPGTDKPAVSHVSFQIKKGEIITLLGPSGCGKTTLLRLIAGFERAEKGSIIIGEKLMSDDTSFIPPEKRGVGMVFQDYALFPHLTVIENVGFGYKEEDKKDRVNEVLDLVNLRGYEKRFPHELSGGQQQRVALARALARRPLVVLLDEPFSNLDADLRDQMRVEIRNIIKNTNTTAVFVSHDQKDALAISDRIIVINEGEIQQIGTPKEIYQEPVNHFVSNFVGRTNLLPGTVLSDNKSVSTCLGMIRLPEGHPFIKEESIGVAVRPESIHVSEKDGMPATVKSFIFKGDSIDTVVAAKMPCGTEQELILSLHPDKELQTGQQVYLTILPKNISFLKMTENNQRT